MISAIHSFMQPIRRHFVYLRRHRRTMVWSFVLLVASVLAEMAGPYLLMIIIDRYLPALADAGHSAFEIAPLVLLISLYMFSFAAASGARGLSSYFVTATAIRIHRQLREDLMRRLRRIPIRYFDQTPAGVTVSKILDDTDEMKNLFLHVNSIVMDAIRLVFMFAAVCWLSPRFGMYALLLIPLFAVIFYFTLKKNNQYLQAAKDSIGLRNAAFAEAVQTMPIVQAYKAESILEDRFERHNNRWYDFMIRQNRLLFATDVNLNGLLNELAIAAIVWTVGSQFLQSPISVGLLYTLISYVRQIFFLIRDNGMRLTNTQASLVSANRVFSLMDEAEEFEGAEEAAEADEPAVGMQGPIRRISFEQVSFAYTDGAEVLKNVSFEASQGQTVALVGHTGSGKSTIVNLLLGLYRPTKGRITIRGDSAETADPASWRGQMSVLLQDTFMFEGTVSDNVDLSNDRKEAGRDVFEWPDAEGYPALAGIALDKDAPVSEQGSALSSGERQLISFARAWARPSSLIILDEPTATVDNETEEAILRALQTRKQHQIQLIVAHRLSTVKDADLILVLHRGEIVERGTHRQLMDGKGKYYRLFELQNKRAAAEEGA